MRSNMMGRVLGFIVTATMLMNFPALAAPRPPQSSEQPSIIAAVETYVRSEAGVQKVRVQRILIEGQYARAQVVPLDVQTDTATAYLRRQGAAWRVLAFGTDFMPNELERLNIPRSLR
jgi:hypothetical protein